MYTYLHKWMKPLYSITQLKEVDMKGETIVGKCFSSRWTR